MEALYYTAMLIGVAWLIVWSVFSEESGIAQRWWWPFDIVNDQTRAKRTEEQQASARGSRAMTPARHAESGFESTAALIPQGRPLALRKFSSWRREIPPGEAPLPPNNSR